MSMLNRPADGAAVGETVTTTKDYAAAQKTVSKLIAGEVPARDIAIVGQGVRTVERITGRLGYATAARTGAMNGVLIGLLLSAVLVLGNPEAPIQLFVGFVLIGVALGMILSLISYMVVRRRRDFASVTQLAADHYEVTVQPASLAKARLVLGSAQRPATVRPPVNLDEPPRYGERIPGGVAPGQSAPAPSAASPVAPQPAPAEPPRYGERIEPQTPVQDAPQAPAQPEPEAPAQAPDASAQPAPETQPDAPAADDDRPAGA